MKESQEVSVKECPVYQFGVCHYLLYRWGTATRIGVCILNGALACLFVTSVPPALQAGAFQWVADPILIKWSDAPVKRSDAEWTHSKVNATL